MNQITIKLLSLEDGDKLFEFECENRAYFEKIGFSRSESYYDRTLFQGILEDLVLEQQKDIHYMYLVLNENNKVIGRVNLTEIIRSPLNKAELGYRIGEHYQNQGYATLATTLVIKEAAKVHHLHRLEAGTSPDNIGSQMVLQKSGFQYVGKYHQYIQIGNEWLDSLLYEKILE